MPSEPLTGDRRCWPCTVANSFVGLLVAWVPLAAALVDGDPSLVAATVGWGIAVSGYTVYRLVARGYLPLSELIAKRTGLHERIGPGRTEDDGNGGTNPEN